MALINISFPYALNVSVQPTDTLYATLTLPSVSPNSQSGTNNPNMSSKTTPMAVGIVTQVNHALNTIQYDDSGFSGIVLTSAHYLFFSKDRIANVSGLIGYFAEAEFRNESTKQTEIHATAVDFVESSK